MELHYLYHCNMVQLFSLNELVSAEKLEINYVITNYVCNGSSLYHCNSRAPLTIKSFVKLYVFVILFYRLRSSLMHLSNNRRVWQVWWKCRLIACLKNMCEGMRPCLSSKTSVRLASCHYRTPILIIFFYHCTCCSTLLLAVLMCL